MKIALLKHSIEIFVKKPYRNQKKNLNLIDKSFFKSEKSMMLIRDNIIRMESSIQSQSDVDILRREIKGLFLAEMEHLPSVGQVKSKNLRKKIRKSQPFWNNELSSRGLKHVQLRKKCLGLKVQNARERQIKSDIRTIFKSSQKIFDQRFRFYKRQHLKRNQNMLHQLPADNIWQEIKKKLTYPPVCPIM